MIFIEVFLHSLKLPTKNAMFKLNRIGMHIAIGYLSIILLIVSIPSLIEQLKITSGLIGQLHIILKLVYFFMFYYLPLTIGILILISILAYIGVGISKMLQRKLRYQIIWKLLAFTTTFPFLVFTVLSFVFPINNLYLLFAIIFALIMLVLMIVQYPKRRNRKK